MTIQPIGAMQTNRKGRSPLIAANDARYEALRLATPVAVTDVNETANEAANDAMRATGAEPACMATHALSDAREGLLAQMLRGMQ